MLEIKKNIFYVGVKDKNTTYNSYIVRGEKTALIETARKGFEEALIRNIEEILPVSEIDYLICNHTEPDHSGCVKEILEINPDIEVVSTIAGVKNLKEITNMPFNEHIAKDMAELALGDGVTLRFMIVPGLPWPDTMVTYTNGALFTCDMFCADYGEAVLDSDIADKEAYDKALELFFSKRLSPFKPFVKKALERLSDIDADTICAGHGPALRNYAKEVIRKYGAWSNADLRVGKTAALFYDSVYGYTAEMADIIEHTMAESGIEVKSFNIAQSRETEMLSALNSSDALAFGSPTINKNASKKVWDIISSLDMINSKGKPYIVFGSYGWGGEGTELVYRHLKMQGMRAFEKPMSVILKPSNEDKERISEFASRFAEFIKKEI